MSAGRVPVRLLRLENGEGLPLPSYESEGAAGADIRAAVETSVRLGPGERFAVPTGFAAEIRDGYEIQVRPRSGLAARKGLTVLNAPGTIDSDYRGEIRVLLVNLGLDMVEISRGERIAQLVIAPVTRGDFEEVDALNATRRGEGGFGSTGA